MASLPGSRALCVQEVVRRSARAAPQNAAPPRLHRRRDVSSAHPDAAQSRGAPPPPGARGPSTGSRASDASGSARGRRINAARSGGWSTRWCAGPPATPTWRSRNCAGWAARCGKRMWRDARPWPASTSTCMGATPSPWPNRWRGGPPPVARSRAGRRAGGLAAAYSGCSFHCYSSPSIRWSEASPRRAEGARGTLYLRYGSPQCTRGGRPWTARSNRDGARDG